MKLLPAVLIIAFFTSCKSDYDFGIESDTQPIINCLFHPDSSWKIEVIQSPSSLWAYRFEPITGAAVKIKEGDHATIIMDQYVAKELGYYTNGSLLVGNIPLKQVSLEVVSPFGTVTAISYIPPKPIITTKILDLTYTKREHKPRNGLFDWEIKGEIRLRIDTRKTGHMWYSVALRYRSNMDYGSPGRIYSNDYETQIYDFLRLNIPYPDAFLTLRKTNGYCMDLTAYDSDKDELILTVDGSIDNLLNAPDFMVLKVSSITEDFLNYNKKVISQYIASQDMFSEPVSVFSNIKGGLGIFSGINSVTDTIRFNIVQY